MNIIGTIPNNKFTLSQLVVQYTVPEAANTLYSIIIIKNKPAEFAKPAIRREIASDCPSKRIAPFTIKELEKKNMKKKGKYIANTSNISG